MPIFKKEKKVETATETQPEGGGKSTRDTVGLTAKGTNPDSILLRPRVTEKASALAERNVYVFEVPKSANKILIKSAVREIYNVSPMKVRIAYSPAKRISSRGIEGVKPATKKALVYLKAGDSIEII